MNNFRLHSRTVYVLLGAVMLALLCSCGTLVVRGEGQVGTTDEDVRRVEEPRRLNIPPGHLPPPGACRIWIPGKPPGHQPRPGSCAELEQQVPLGAWLVYRSTDRPEQVEVMVHHERRPAVVVAVHYFEVSTGRLVRHDH